MKYPIATQRLRTQIQWIATLLQQAPRCFIRPVRLRVYILRRVPGRCARLVVGCCFVWSSDIELTQRPHAALNCEDQYLIGPTMSDYPLLTVHNRPRAASR